MFNIVFMGIFFQNVNILVFNRTIVTLSLFIKNVNILTCHIVDLLIFFFDLTYKIQLKKYQSFKLSN